MIFALMMFVGNAANADETSGKCKFVGDRPKYTLTSGTLTVRHMGDLRKMGTVGNRTVWETSDSTWVIYGSANDRKQNVVMAYGMIQTCDNY